MSKNLELKSGLDLLALLDIDARLQGLFVHTTPIQVINGGVIIGIKNDCTDTCGVVLAIIAEEDVIDDYLACLRTAESHLVNLRGIHDLIIIFQVMQIDNHGGTVANGIAVGHILRRIIKPHLGINRAHAGTGVL